MHLKASFPHGERRMVSSQLCLSTLNCSFQQYIPENNFLIFICYSPEFKPDISALFLVSKFPFLFPTDAIGVLLLILSQKLLCSIIHSRKVRYNVWTEQLLPLKLRFVACVGIDYPNLLVNIVRSFFLVFPKKDIISNTS
ncbi:hypothetical protein CEXT_802241 [Caerostris extrusa]|uniref:Uncharacterized protein n=1 Tax=Caerostris extrusa TaxID=172846 RepID=A0AAV4NWU0_CAEEX|nr:hypothetical protein CEXT_802241 [Caerostris extrusa]